MFLDMDTKVNVEEFGLVSFGIYRNKTHIDLDFNSHHHIRQITEIIHTFRNRVDSIIPKVEDKKHLNSTYQMCTERMWPPRMVASQRALLHG